MRPHLKAGGLDIQATTTKGSDSEEEFHAWSAADDDELSKAAEKPTSGYSMLPPETPRKAVKTGLLATPGKRRRDDMALENGDTGPSVWPTPSTGTRGADIFTTPSSNAGGKGFFANAPLPSPETPTPIRYRDIPSTRDSEFASEFLSTLQIHRVSLPPEAQEALKKICNKHVLYTRGIMKGRDVSRALAKAKDEKIAELQGEIEGFKEEVQTNKAVIRHLRKTIAVRKEAGK